MATPEQVATFRQANLAITKKVEKDLANFWSHMNPSRHDASVNALLKYVPTLSARYGEIAATIAADWYELLRADAVDAGLLKSIKGATSYRTLAADPNAAKVAARARAAVESAGGYLWTDAPDRALRALQGTIGRHVLQAGRDTITTNAVQDKGAQGWVRVGFGECDWCADLLDGEVHYVEGYGFDAHDNCRCLAVPSFG